MSREDAIRVYREAKLNNKNKNAEFRSMKDRHDKLDKAFIQVEDYIKALQSCGLIVADILRPLANGNCISFSFLC
jgi:hypothetical protein